MPARWRILGALIWVARSFGLLLIALGILSLPPMRFLTGHLAVSLEVISCVALTLMGVACLVGVELFLGFFDQYMSRN
jgi:hypothetical protein